MRVKDSYSLTVDDILDELPTTENLPVRYDGGINPVTVRGNYEDSLNIFKAFANYLVERNRTRNLRQQIAAAETALDARNEQARLQSELIIADYAERLNNFLDEQRREFELETRRIELESAAQIQQIQHDREAEHSRITELIRLLEWYRSFLTETQKFLAEIEQSAEMFVTKNKFYYRAKEDCRLRLKWIRDLLKKIDLCRKDD